MPCGMGSDKSVPIVVADALAADPGERFDVGAGESALWQEEAAP